MRRESRLGERDWSKRPLFTARRRRSARWLLLALVLFVATVLYLYPGLVRTLLKSLLPA